MRAVLVDGTTQVTSFTANYDGQPFPYQGTNGDTTTIATADAYTTEATVMKNGKVTQVTRNRVSVDGKTMTSITRGTDPAGNTFSSTRIYDEQKDR